MSGVKRRHAANRVFVRGPIVVGCVLTLWIAGLAPGAHAQIYHVARLNTAELRAFNKQRTVVILPGGILEEHGPYLPSFTDGYRNERLTQDLADAIVARRGWSVLLFPMIPLGAGVYRPGFSGDSFT